MWEIAGIHGPRSRNTQGASTARYVVNGREYVLGNVLKKPMLRLDGIRVFCLRWSIAWSADMFGSNKPNQFLVCIEIK